MAAREDGASRGKMLRAAFRGMRKSASAQSERRAGLIEARRERAAQNGNRAPRRKNSRGTSPEDYEH
jgi:hypothetical protein